MNPKQIAGEQAVSWVEDGMTLGLGTGSTTYFALKALGKRVREGLQVQGVATSSSTEEIAREEGISMLSVEEVSSLDVYIDGADEIDAIGNMIKGGGGALFREKLVASLAKQRIIILDDSKVVDRLGRFPLPIEVVPFGWQHVARKIEAMGVTPQLRRKEEETYLTDNGNYLLDCVFGSIPDPAHLHHELKQLIGVVETGLFANMAHRVVVGFASGKCQVFDPAKEAVRLSKH